MTSILMSNCTEKNEFTTPMSENQNTVSPDNQLIVPEDSPAQSIPREENCLDKNNVRSITSKQISNVIEFQEPSTSTNYSFKTEIRINILGEPKPSQKSIETNDSVTLSMFNEDIKAKKELTEIEESFTTIDNCIKEKMTSTNDATMFSRNDRTQRAILVNSEAPPPYDSHPPPAYSSSPHQTPQPIYQQTTGSSSNGGYYPYEFDYSSLLNIQIRHHFIQKVFFILFVQLIITATMILLTMFHQPTRRFVVTNMAMLWIMSALELIIYFTLMCYPVTRRIFPLNFILLLLFTIAFSYICAALTVFYSTKVILTTVSSTAIICLVVSLLAYQTWFDITKWNFILVIASIIFLIFAIIVMIVSIFTYSLVLWLVYSAVATLIFTVYLLYDMQRIFGGRAIEMSPEEYIYGALTLYVDILMIFVYMLQLINACHS